MFSPRKSIGDRIANGILATLASTAGVVSKIWSLFSGSQQDDWQGKVRSQVTSAYSGEGDRLAEAFTRHYHAKAKELCRQVQESVDVRIGEMEAQLQDIIREKEAKEQDALARQAMLKEKQEELRTLAREMEN